LVCGWCARRRAADGVRCHGAALGSIYRRSKWFVTRKISAGELCTATTAQRRRRVPRLAGRFDLQWGTAQAWIAEGGLAGRTCMRASSSCCSLSARGVLSSSAATCLSPAARRLLGARSTCTTRCVDGASKAEKAVADNLQAPTRMLLAGMEVGSRRRGVSKGE